MTDDERLIESLDRHFLAGCGYLDDRQFRAHQVAGSCPACRARASATAIAEPVLAVGAS